MGDQQLMKRTTIDLVMLVPYSIIMIIPLTPPGHVFAFSMLKRCFPAAVPSAFTETRQDLLEVYSQLSAPAVEKSRIKSSLRKVRWTKRAALMFRKLRRRTGTPLDNADATTDGSSSL